MLYLITGTNGAGKTLNTLKWVRERQLKENRPVAHNGRFDVVPGGELDSWKKIDFQNWQDEPDGTIFVVDECHNDLPKTVPSAKQPEYIRMLAEHRKRGFDFYLISQHPLNVDAFVRRLIGSPGWHRHLKRTFGGDLVSVLEWSSVNDKCEKDGSGKSGTVSMVAFPKEVFSWYKSASLHTGKRKIPKTVWALGVMLILIPILLFGAYRSLQNNVSKRVEDPGMQDKAQAGGGGASGLDRSAMGHLSTTAYLDKLTPRLPDFPHTAPAYDSVTQPKQAPYPAACVTMARSCKCYTQQATVMPVAFDVCMQIVKNGYFVDWQEPRAEMAQKEKPDQVRVASRQETLQPVRSVPMPEIPEQKENLTWSQALELRNSQVRSNIAR